MSAGKGFGLGRRVAMTALAMLTVPGSLLVAWFTKDGVGLDVMDFWVGSLAMVVLAFFEVLIFGWVLGAERGLREANRGSDLRIPAFFGPIIRYVCPLYLTLILGSFAYQNFGAQVRSILERPEAMVTATFMIATLILLLLLVRLAQRRWDRDGRTGTPQGGPAR